MKTKKLIVSILIFLAIIAVTIFTNSVRAEGLGNLTITKERNVGDVTYKHQMYTTNTAYTKNVWKLVTCNPDGTITDTINDLYCLRAGLGFTSESLTNTVVEYNIEKAYAEMSNYFSGVSTEVTIFNEENKDKFNAVMWILDNMLLEEATDEQVNTYLKTFAGYTDETLNNNELKDTVLTRADIEAIQQLAIWYFTNTDEIFESGDAAGEKIYSKEILPSLYMSINSEEYKTYEDIFNTYDTNGDPVAYGEQRQEKANALYTTLIAKAKEAVSNLGENEDYKPLKDIKVYLAGTNAATEQPVVRISEKGEVDLALRKFVSAVNGTKLEGENSRAPIANTSNLNQTIDEKFYSTATYDHKKEHLKVNLGDIITYTLRLYNEGEVDTYIKEAKDYLPEYVTYVKSDNESENEWTVDDTGRTATTKDIIKVVGASENLQDQIGQKMGDVLIPAAKYNEETESYDLSYIDIEIPVKISENAPYDVDLTNIAEITKITDKNGNVVETDRDSVSAPKGNLSLPADNDLPNYTGGANGKNDPYYDGSNIITKILRKIKEVVEGVVQEKVSELTVGSYYPGQEDDDDFEKIYIEAPEIDLALRKFISAVNDTKLEGENSRAPEVDTSKLNKEVDGVLQTTAIYNQTKKPLKVEIGDTVTYTLRIYNEGKTAAYVKAVTDYLPEYLEYEGSSFLLDDQTGRKATTTEFCTVVGVGGNISDTNIGKRPDEILLPAAQYDAETDSYVLSFIDIELECKVKATTPYDTNVTNLAQITEMAYENGRIAERDEDSVPDGNFTLPDDENLPTYKDEESDKPYVPGQEDDDDFEKIVIVAPKPDLAVRKFISAVDGEKLTGENSREPVVNTKPLDENSGTTAEYNHSKKPITVNKGSLITYTIRVYNEGEINLYASQVTDYLPNYLIYLPENETNIKYGWTYDEETRQVKTTITAKENEAGDEVYASRQNGKLLFKYSENQKLDYIDVEIVCKLDENALGNRVLTNLAQITEIKDEEGNKIEQDRDSTPDGEFNLPEDKDRPTYKDDESDKPYVPGQEDDDDFEKVLVKPDYDLALRKFITKIGNTNVNNRYPEVSFVDGKLKYTHTKNPLDVVTGDIVIYTLRIYNEGEADGYANEVTDDVPEGLEFLVDNEINKEYRWRILDENQQETSDITKAKYIITDYLSEEQAKETGRNNLIKAFDREAAVTEANPDYRDIKIAFKVTYTANTIEEAARIITNEAQISDDSDDDNDSVPKRDELYDYDKENEDDIDFEKIKVKYFDLSLLKWVSQTKVTLNGKTTITDTGHTAETSKNESPVKIEIKEKDINKINIKYIYTIRVTNEGEIEGYAKEVTDYIPKGLKFEEADNPDWYMIGDGIIGTKALENTLLKPGEYAEVQVVLTWINGKDNFGEKINVAEISLDYNESGNPDIDSTPNNKVPEEDDIDDAPVIVTVKTGAEQIYIGLVLIVLVTFAGGTGLIKKYVLE